MSHTGSTTGTTPAFAFGPTVTAIACASAMLPFTVTGSAIALPAMAADLGSSVGATQWVLNAFNVTFAALPLLAGSIADRIGRRRVLLAGIGVVGAMSLVIGLAPGIVWVDLARAVQGCGAAAVLAAGAAVLAASTQGRRRRLAFGVLGSAFGSGLAVGPLLAGALVALAGWRAVFLVVAVLCAGAALLARQAPESRNPAPARLDLAGAATFTAGLAGLAFAFVSAGTAGWADPVTVALLVGCAALLAAFVLVELRRGPDAMFDVRLFRRPEFAVVMGQPFTITLGFVVLLVYLPPYLQGVGGATSLRSGLLLLPLTLPVLVLPVLAGRWAARSSVRVVLAGSSASIAAGALLLLTLGPDPSPLRLVGPLLPFGIGVGLAFGVMDNAAVGTVPVQSAGTAAGMFNTMRIAGETVAAAAAAALLTTWTGTALTSPGLSRAQAEDIAGRAVHGAVDPARLPALAGGLTGAFHILGLVLAVLSGAGAVLTLLGLRKTP